MKAWNSSVLTQQEYFLTGLKIIVLSERSFCNMISRCENKMVHLIVLALRDLCWDYAVLLSAPPRGNFACFQNLVQVGKQSFVFKKKIEFQST